MASVNINEPGNANVTEADGYGSLLHHIMPIVRENRTVRDRKHKRRWDMYERTFRGMYTGADKTREGERSRLVAPALAAAIESTAAAIEDAIFSREKWFDAEDDVSDQNKQDISAAQALLNEDFEEAGVPDAIAKIVLNGCLYGTGIGKLNVVKREIRRVVDGKIQKDLRTLVTLESLPPWEVVIDSQARDIRSAYFIAHETHVPRNVIFQRQRNGTYRKVNIVGNTATTTASPAGIETPDGQRKTEHHDGSVFVTEYYGLVPAAALQRARVQFQPEDVRADGHVEVIVTIANELEVLRAVVNPFAYKDRPILAYQHSTVPGKFWGRGVAEKGWNAQRALDAELRARMDALGLLTSPMMGADITRLPRNPDMRVRPGKVWLTRGRPSEVLEPVILGNIDPNTFNQSSEMERLVQVGTGAIDSNAPLNVDRRNETASGISMIQSSALKRMRRTMWNLERQFLNPFIKQAMQRYMQFAPQRYRDKDFNFMVKGTMGIVAREFEQAQLIGLLSNIPPDSPQYNLVLRAIIELSTSPKRDQILQQIDKMAEPTPEQKQMEQIQMMSAQEALKEQMEENRKTQAETELILAQIRKLEAETQIAAEKLKVDQANALTGAAKVEVEKEKVKMQKSKGETSS